MPVVQMFTIGHVDMMVTKRLSENNIVLREPIYRKTWDQIMTDTCNQFTKQHLRTVNIFAHYVYPEMGRVVVSKEDMTLSTRYAFVSVVIAGIIDGIERYAALFTASNGRWEYRLDFEAKIPKLFSADEFEMIGSRAAGIVQTISERMHKALEWSKKMVDVESETIVHLHTDKTSINTAEHVNRVLSTYFSEQIEFGTGENGNMEENPYLEFLYELQMLMTHLEVLHYGGYYNTKKNSLTDIRFIYDPILD